MQVLFFQLDKSFDEVGKLIISCLGFNNLIESETTFNTKGYYFIANTLGLTIKLDENNYDYEDKYNYMITIKKAIGTKLYSENSILGVAEIVASIISSKLNIQVALEEELRNPDSEVYFLKIFLYNGGKVILEFKEFKV